MRYHHIPIRMIKQTTTTTLNAGEDAKKTELHISGGNITAAVESSLVILFQALILDK